MMAAYFGTVAFFPSRLQLLLSELSCLYQMFLHLISIHMASRHLHLSLHNPALPYVVLNSSFSLLDPPICRDYWGWRK